MNTIVSNLDIKEIGRVKEVRHGIVKIDGLPSCVYGQLVQFSSGTRGMIIEFTPQQALGIVLGAESSVSVGDTVSSYGGLAAVPVGEDCIGTIVNSLAEPLDGSPRPPRPQMRLLFAPAPGIMDREPLHEPFYTGVKIIDLTIPIGKGQRELIIGDRQTGKTSIALDAICNQRGKGTVCVYCWIGGPQSALLKHIHILRQKGALAHTVVVAAPAGTSCAEQYVAPYAAAALGEYFMHAGKDVLVVFDDLTKHAWAYRQMSLLLERAPGREAYPGDIFYVHSQLLERAACLRHDAGTAGAGTMTFLPIVETLQGDITGYVQTNLISITDGQIYLDAHAFKEGFKPAIDLGLSVSRIGSRAQCPAMREVSQGIRLEYAQYRELLRLTKMRTRLSAEALERMKRGEILCSLLAQQNAQPVSMEEMVVLFYAFKRKILEVVSPAMLTAFLQTFFSHAGREHEDVLKRLARMREITPDIRKDVDDMLVAFFRTLKEQERR